MRISPLIALLLFSLSLAHAQQVQVFDETGSPLPGVLIYNTDKSFSTTTDEHGLADLHTWNQQGPLHFTLLGYKNTSLSLTDLKKLNFTLQLQPHPRQLEAILIIGRRGETVENILTTVEVLPARNLLFSQAQNIPDALEKESGLYIQKSQMGGGSPIMRGFEANRVLLVVDGIRMNNAIYRSGHLQNSLTVDAQLIDRIELIYGPGSLEYGSDALGGVLHFRTRNPQLKTENTRTLSGQLHSRFSTANKGKSIHLSLQQGYAKWAWLTSFSAASFGDLRAGSRRPKKFPDFGKRLYYAQFENGTDLAIPNPKPNIQTPTGYAQIDLGQKILRQLSNSLRLSANIQFSNSTNIPRYDQLAITENAPDKLKFAEWHYGPQQRFLAAFEALWKPHNTLFDEALSILAWQALKEERIKRRFNRTLRTINTENVTVLSYTLDFKKTLNRKSTHLLSYGLDIQLNNVHSTAVGEDVQTATTFNILTRYPAGGSSLHRGGAYALYRGEPASGLFKWQAGLRYAFSTLQARYRENILIDWPQSYLEPGIRNHSSGLSYGLGIHFPHVRGWVLKASLATAFRAPNIDDIGKIRAKNGKLSIPNPDLKPERTTSAEINLGYKTSGQLRSHFFLSAFYTDINGLVNRRVYPLPDGSTSIDFEGEILTTVANLNEQSGFIYGLSANASLHLNNELSLGGSFSYTRGRVHFYKEFQSGPLAVADTLLPLAHIPPPYGRLNLLYEGKKWQAEAVLRFNLAKKPEAYAVADLTYDASGQPVFDRLGTSDNLEYTPAYTDENGQLHYAGALAWQTLNLYYTRSFGESLNLYLALENVLDIHYRTFSSGLSAPGFNCSVSMLWSF